MSCSLHDRESRNIGDMAVVEKTIAGLAVNDEDPDDIGFGDHAESISLGRIGSHSHAQTLRLTVVGLAGNVLGVLDISEDSTAAELKELLSSRHNIPLELLQIIHEIIGPDGAEILRGRNFLSYYRLRRRDRITCLRLQVPQGYDVVHNCDACDDLRHLFYAYARQAPEADYEPVAAYCEACGGKPWDPCSPRSSNTSSGDHRHDDDDDADDDDGRSDADDRHDDGDDADDGRSGGRPPASKRARSAVTLRRPTCSWQSPSPRRPTCSQESQKRQCCIP